MAVVSKASVCGVRLVFARIFAAERCRTSRASLKPGLKPAVDSTSFLANAKETGQAFIGLPYTGEWMPVGGELLKSWNSGGSSGFDTMTRKRSMGKHYPTADSHEDQ